MAEAYVLYDTSTVPTSFFVPLTCIMMSTSERGPPAAAGGATRVRCGRQHGGGLLHPPDPAHAHERDALHGVPHAEQTPERAQGGIPSLRKPPDEPGRPQGLHVGGKWRFVLRWASSGPASQKNDPEVEGVGGGGGGREEKEVVMGRRHMLENYGCKGVGSHQRGVASLSL